MTEVRRRRRNGGVVVARVQEEHAIVFLPAAGLFDEDCVIDLGSGESGMILTRALPFFIHALYYNLYYPR
jgi:hypothetical protein